MPKKNRSGVKRKRSPKPAVQLEEDIYEEATLGFFEWIDSEDAPKAAVARAIDELSSPRHLLKMLLRNIIAEHPDSRGSAKTDDGRLTLALTALFGEPQPRGRPPRIGTAALEAVARIYLERQWHNVVDDPARMPALRTMCEWALRETHPAAMSWDHDTLHNYAGDLEKEFKKKKVNLILLACHHPKEKELKRARTALRDLGILS